VDKKIYLHYLL